MNKLETLLRDLMREGKIDTHEVAAIIVACDMAYESRKQFVIEGGSFSLRGLVCLLTRDNP